MHKLFLKYQSDPEILKMIKSWNREKAKMNRLKQDLRTRENVDELIEVNTKQLQIHHKIWDYIYEQEDALVPHQRYTAGVMIGILLFAVGIVNLVLLLRIL